MKQLILLLLALPLWAANAPTAIRLVTGPNTPTYSTIDISFDSVGSWSNWRVRVNPSATCAAMSGGTLQAGPASGGTTFNSDYRIVVGGLPLGASTHMCVELSDDGGSTFSPSGASGEIVGTTLSVIDNDPHPVKKFDQRIPDYGDITTMPLCGVGLNAQSYCKIVEPPGTTTIQADYDTALTNQCTNGTVITLAASATPVVFTQNIYSNIFASCGVEFFDSTKITGNNIDFGFAHGLTEGQLLTYGNHGFNSPPSSNSCYHGNGFNGGARFLAHVVSANVISLRCGDGSNNAVVISSAGGYPSNQEWFLPHVTATGMCRDVAGLVPCSYKKINSFKVIIRTATADSLLPPQGTHITPAYFTSGLGAIIANPVSNVNNPSSSAAFIATGNNDGNVGNVVNNVVFGPGIEVTNEFDGGQRNYCNMFFTQIWQSDITFDRVYFHGGDTKPPNLQRWGGPSCPAAILDGYNISVQDSWIDNLRHWFPTSGTSGTSILTSNGPGPVMITNTHWEGAGAPMYHMDNGGGESFLSGDVTLLRNTFYSPTFMMVGSPDSDGNYSGLRQSVEIKGIWGNESRGNRFINTWTEENPNSMFYVVTSVSPPGGQGEGAIDINISDNIFSHGPGGIDAPVIVYGGGRVTVSPARFKACNNLYYGVEGKWGVPGSVPKGWWMQAPGGGEGLNTCHTTWVGNSVTQPTGWTPVIGRAQSGFMAGWKFNDNFIWNMQSPGWGYQREGGIGVDACFNLVGAALANCNLIPGYEWTNNVFMSPTETAANIATQWGGVIANNYNPTNMSLSVTPGWTKYDGTGDNGNYRLLPTSNYRSGAAKTSTTGPASDGADVGVNWTGLQNATGHVDQPTVTPIAATTASVNFSAPDNLSCPVSVTTTTPWTSSSVPTSGVTPFPDSGTAPGARKVNLNGLASGTLYYYIVNCAVEQPTGQFKTR